MNVLSKIYGVFRDSLDHFQQVGTPEFVNRAFPQEGQDILAKDTQDGRLRVALAGLDFQRAPFEPLMERRFEAMLAGQQDGLPFCLRRVGGWAP